MESCFSLQGRSHDAISPEGTHEVCYATHIHIFLCFLCFLTSSAMSRRGKITSPLQLPHNGTNCFIYQLPHIRAGFVISTNNNPYQVTTNNNPHKVSTNKEKCNTRPQVVQMYFVLLGGQRTQVFGSSLFKFMLPEITFKLLTGFPFALQTGFILLFFVPPGTTATLFPANRIPASWSPCSQGGQFGSNGDVCRRKIHDGGGRL